MGEPPVSSIPRLSRERLLVILSLPELWAMVQPTRQAEAAKNKKLILNLELPEEQPHLLMPLKQLSRLLVV